MPRWHPVSISGYHIREAGSTAAQELAFTLKDGLTYVEQALERGLDVDDFAPRLSFFFNAHIDFFEEIAKYRAARRIWARELRDTFGARDERSLLMRFHTQTAGVSLTAQQPLNNIIRTAIEALAGVLGGTQSLHTNSFDEALALPDRAGGAGGAADPADHRRGDGRGQHDRPSRWVLLPGGADRPDGGLAATSTSPRSMSWEGWSRPSSRASPSARSRMPPSGYQVEVESGARRVVGVNAYTEGDDELPPTLRIDPRFEPEQVRRVQALRRKRDNDRTQAALAASRRRRAIRRENLMPHLLEAARAQATEGEMIQTLQRVFGTYTETPAF